MVVVKYSTAINHYTALNLTKLDVLDSFETIKVATGYKDPQTGQELESFPASLEQLANVEVIYKELPGWNTPITHIKKYEELPKEARDYVEVCLSPVSPHDARLLIWSTVHREIYQSQGKI